MTEKKVLDTNFVSIQVILNILLCKVQHYAYKVYCVFLDVLRFKKYL